MPIVHSDEANVETHGFDPALVNNHLNPACSPLWTNAIVGETNPEPAVLLFLLVFMCLY